MGVSAFLGTGPGHSRELRAAERHRRVSRTQIPQYTGDLPGPPLLPLVLQLQLTAHFSKCVLCLWDSRVTAQTPQGALFLHACGQARAITFPPLQLCLSPAPPDGSSSVGTRHNPFL